MRDAETFAKAWPERQRRIAVEQARQAKIAQQEVVAHESALAEQLKILEDPTSSEDDKQFARRLLEEAKQATESEQIRG